MILFKVIGIQSKMKKNYHSLTKYISDYMMDIISEMNVMDEILEFKKKLRNALRYKYYLYI